MEIDWAEVDGVIFDLDGVITDTATLHREAWKEVFDEVLRRHLGEGARWFSEEDYLQFVDGKPRRAGIESFLASRSLKLEQEEMEAIGDEKNRRYQERIEAGEATILEGAVELLEELQAGRWRVGLVSSSRNAELVLRSLGLEHYFEVRVDGETLAEHRWPGKPEPRMFVEAARRLGVAPERAVVVEDAVAGVQAGVAGGFAVVVGVARDEEQRRALEEAGAHGVVTSVAALRFRRG